MSRTCPTCGKPAGCFDPDGMNPIAGGSLAGTRLHNAATALIADVRRRYPGEELRCPFMRELDAALRWESAAPTADETPEKP